MNKLSIILFASLSFFSCTPFGLLGPQAPEEIALQKIVDNFKVHFESQPIMINKVFPSGSTIFNPLSYRLLKYKLVQAISFNYEKSISNKPAEAKIKIIHTVKSNTGCGDYSPDTPTAIYNHYTTVEKAVEKKDEESCYDIPINRIDENDPQDEVYFHLSYENKAWKLLRISSKSVFE